MHQHTRSHQYLSRDMQALFDPVIAQIIELIIEQITEAKVRKGAKINVRFLLIAYEMPNSN